MIEQQGLTDTQYAALKSALERPSYQVYLERYDLDFSSLASRAELTDDALFDAEMCGEYIRIAFLDDNGIGVWGAAASAGAASASSHVVDASVGAIAPTIIADGSTVRIFYYEGGKIKYVESADYGQTFGGASDVETVSGISYLAPVSLSKVHYVTVSDGNSRLHYTEYSGGAWTSTDSDIYIPHGFTGFDAVRLDSKTDVVAVSTDLPISVGVRAQGINVSRIAYLSGGVVAFRQQNGRWSDHVAVETFDDQDTYQYRRHVRLSLVGGKLFLLSRGSDGDQHSSHQTYHMYTSRDGEWWSHDFLYQLPDSVYGAKLLFNSPHVFLVGKRSMQIAYSTDFTGEVASGSRTDITTRIGSYTSNMSGVRQSQVMLSNADGWMDSSILANDGVYMIRPYWGHIVSGSPARVQVSLEELDYIKPETSVPGEHISLVSRDRMAWMLDRVKSPHSVERESQMVGVDDYADQTESGYGGLRHTAIQSGAWRTADNTLKLISNNKEGITFTTWKINIWNGSSQIGFRLASNSNDEYAGIIFRAFDKDNLWHATYRQSDDKIHIYQRSEGEDESKTTSSAMGWSSSGVWRYLKVVVRYSLIKVYSSTDNANWVEQISYIAPGGGTPAAFLSGGMVIESGYMGQIGKGYSDEDTWSGSSSYGSTSPPDPPSSSGGYSSLYLYTGVQKIAAVNTDGYLYRTSDFQTLEASGGPTWERVDLGVDGDPCSFCVDPFSSLYIGTGNSVDGWLATSKKIYRVTDIFGAMIVQEQYTFPFETPLRIIDASFGTQSHVVCVSTGSCSSYGGDGNTHSTYTTDGTNWADVKVAPYTVSNTHTAMPGLHISSRTPGLVYTSAYTADGTWTPVFGYKSTDYGATWTKMSSFPADGPNIQSSTTLVGDIHIPWDDNASELIAYYGGNASGTGNYRVWRAESDGTRTEILTSATSYSGRKQITSWPSDRQYVVLSVSYEATPYFVYISQNAGDSMTDITYKFVGANTRYVRCEIAGNSSDHYYFFGARNAYLLAYSGDQCQTVEDKTGNILSDWATSGYFIHICGG